MSSYLSLANVTASWPDDLLDNHLTCFIAIVYSSVVPGNLPSRLEILTTGQTCYQNSTYALKFCNVQKVHIRLTVITDGVLDASSAQHPQFAKFDAGTLDALQRSKLNTTAVDLNNTGVVSEAYVAV